MSGTVRSGEEGQLSKLPLVSIILVSYNTREMTLECLRSVMHETRTDFELIVLDNDSSDGSAQAVRREFPQVTLIESRLNLGFAGGNNAAARGASGEYILLLNPDTVILDGAIDKLVEFARHRPQALIWGGKTLYGDRSLNRTSCFQNMTLWTIFCRFTGLSVLTGNHRWFSEAYGGWEMDGVREVDVVTACFLLMPHGLWRDLGGFDEAFFMYAEEADLCMRAVAQYGARPAFTPDAVIIHYGGASEKVKTDKVIKLTRAKLALVDKHFRGSRRWLARQFLIGVPLTRHLSSGLAAVLSKARFTATARFWSEVWTRRSEWMN